MGHLQFSQRSIPIAFESVLDSICEYFASVALVFVNPSCERITKTLNMRETAGDSQILMNRINLHFKAAERPYFPHLAIKMKK